MILRLDDTDVERNTDASVNSIFEGLKWLDLGWDEEYKQSEGLAPHRQMAETIFEQAEKEPTFLELIREKGDCLQIETIEPFTEVIGISQVHA